MSLMAKTEECTSQSLNILKFRTIAKQKIIIIRLDSKINHNTSSIVKDILYEKHFILS